MPTRSHGRTRPAGLAVVLVVGLALAPAVPAARAATTTVSGFVDAGGDSWVAEPFAVPEPGTITATLDWSDAAADLNLFLFDPAGTLVAFSTSTGARPEVVSHTTPVTGTWRVGVKARTSSSAFVVSVEAPGDATEPPPAPAGGTLTFSGSLDASGASWASQPFDLAGPGAITATLDWADASADLNPFLYAPDGALVAFSTSTTARPEVLEHVAPVGGTWRIGVKARSGASPYTLTVNVPDGAVPSPNGLPELRAMRQIGGRGHAGLYAWGMASAPDGTVLIGDYWNYRVQRYSTAGALVGTFVPPGPSHLAPYGIAVDPTNGDVYVSDVDAGATVDKYDSNGNLLLQLGGPRAGSGPNRFVYPSRVAVAVDRTVYVADARDSTISAHSPQGAELFAVSNAQTPRPRGIAVHPGGDVYVVDEVLRRVQVFDRELRFLRSIGEGRLGGDLRGIALDAGRGWLYVTSAADDRVYKFATDGTFLQGWGSHGSAAGQFLGGPREVTVDRDGNVWVADMPNFRAQKFTPWGGFLLEVPEPPEPPAAGGFAEPRAVGVDGQGNVFVADTHNWRIQKFAPDGSILLQWGNRGRSETEFNYPKGLAVDAATGAVYVCDSDNGEVKKYTNDGVHVWTVLGLRGPLDADVAPDGTVVVADTQNARLVVLAPGTGARLRTIGSRGTANGQFLYPTGVDVDRDGSIWVADTQRDVVQHLTASGGFLGAFGSRGTGDGQLDVGWGVAAVGGHVFVTDAGTNQIKAWTKAGAFVASYGGGGAALGRFMSPKGLDVAPNGRLYVVEHSGERVQELAVSGA